MGRERDQKEGWAKRARASRLDETLFLTRLPSRLPIPHRYRAMLSPISSCSSYPAGKGQP
ncbi:hypothetical protein LZ30DRAFT_733704 [Colletotrichum cereale]|nr:hypothetical protein LZ30DRAFT_733704 [Colletotrichum cereale]